MTYSLLAIDEKTGAFVAAAATGSLCVGGWVIRGRLGAGLVASQGTAPSTLWRDDALRRLETDTAEVTVAAVTGRDTGRAHRQLAVLSKDGLGAGFTGDAAVPYAAHVAEDGFVASGNMLSGPEVLAALAERWLSSAADPVDRAVEALEAAERCGGDARGLMSAALLVLRPDAAPLDLRIDRSDRPLQDLRALLEAARTVPYADWLGVVPTVSDPMRAPDQAHKLASDAAE
ncbi:MAG: DUF1028 domain-containing protein [Pseudomonadota bacterium]